MTEVARITIKNSEEAETKALARKLAPLLLASDLLILSGDLGAGKTYFTRALCRALGLPSDEPVTSPTYTLVQEIPTRPPIVHCDLYRLRSPDEVFDLGLDEHRRAGSILVVEWGSPFVEALGGEAITLHFELEPRSVEVFGEGRRAREIVASLEGSRGLGS
jgi:tRNA threonylcarbamoyladenosine biosynthesis protein TsaE